VALGAAISSLRDDGVLILGSGGAVHPLGYAAASLGEGAATDRWTHEFSGRLTDAVTRGDRVSLVTIGSVARTLNVLTRTPITSCRFL
jgi:4,5-DOPA dioxygenase extradiol